MKIEERNERASWKFRFWKLRVISDWKKEKNNSMNSSVEKGARIQISRVYSFCRHGRRA